MSWVKICLLQCVPSCYATLTNSHSSRRLICNRLTSDNKHVIFFPHPTDQLGHHRTYFSKPVTQEQLRPTLATIQKGKVQKIMSVKCGHNDSGGHNMGHIKVKLLCKETVKNTHCLDMVEGD